MSGPDEKRGAMPRQPAPPAPASPSFDRGLALALDQAGRAKLSVTILLDRRPTASEASIEPLVMQATLAFTARLDASYFARSADFRLRDGQADLQHVQAMGEGPAAAFGLTIAREPALRVLAALRGDESGLSLRCEVERREEGEAQTIIVKARLTDVLGAIGDAELLDRETIGVMMETLSGEGRLSISPAGKLPREQLVDAFLAMARPLLRPVTTAGGRRWRVLPVPPNAMILSARIERTAKVSRALHYEAPLEKLFASIGDLDQYVRIVAPDGDGGFGPVPPLQAQRRSRANARVKLGRVDGGSVAQLQALARPSRVGTSAHMMIAAATAQPFAAIATRIRPEFIDIADLHVIGAGGAPREESLPQIDDRMAPLWRDRIDPNAYWYAPDFALVRPAPAEDPESATFGLVFHAEGHRADGTPGLQGSLRFRLLRQMGAETQAAWDAAGKPTIAPVPTDNLSVQLLIPFRDESGATRGQAFPATITEAGDAIDVAVDLLDDWLRLAYGSIAYPGFQAQPPELSVAYSFRGYVPIDAGNLQLLFDRKQALVALRPGKAMRGRGDAFFDTETLSWRDGATTLTLNREPVSAQMRAGSRLVPMATAMLAIKPNLLQTATVAELVRRRRYGVQSTARAQALPAVFPCNEFGSFYREETADGIKAIGCQDAFRLGQTVYRQYERIDALSDGTASVWRSLQQPGRFLAVPQRWSIVRFGRDEPADRAWRPAIFLYSSVDPDNADKNRCALLGSLVPDIDPVRMFELGRALRALAAEPHLLSLVDIDAEVAFRWTVPSLNGLTLDAVRLDDCIQVTAECPLDTMPLLLKMIETAGIAGGVSFKLPDGTSFDSDLRIDLARIVGPGPDGPVEIERHEDRLTLANRIERAIDVAEILIDTTEAAPATIAVDSRIEPGQSIDVEPVATDAVIAVRCRPADGAAELTEIRSFVEDVHSNIAFVNLINYEVHALAALSIEARIRGADGSRQLLLDKNEPVSSLEFVLPLTRYLAKPVLEYAVTKSFADGTGATTGWLEWSLADDGNVVSLTWEHIA